MSGAVSSKWKDKKIPGMLKLSPLSPGTFRIQKLEPFLVFFSYIYLLVMTPTVFYTPNLTVT